MRLTIRSLRSLAARRPLVLVYHRIAFLPSDRWGLAVSPETFDAQLRLLRRFFRPVALHELLDAVRHGNGRGCVAVTFDDGYADNYATALPLLEKNGVPATFFVTSDPIEHGREFWWDELERQVDPSQYLDRWHELAALPSSERERRLGGRPPARESHRPMTPDELRSLAASPLVDVGSHGRTHSNLTRLSPDQVREEVETGRVAVQRLTGRDVTLFSYPFGAFSDDTDRVVQAAGFRAACTSISASIAPRPDVFRIPRCNVTNVSGLRFLRLILGAIGRRDATTAARPA
jgi:peptidoglycan/xylan/chitin deacetylase (PgdA/CDA1 family)